MSTGLAPGGSLPFYLAVLALGLGQLVDVRHDVGGWLVGIFLFRVEEPLELVAALLLNRWLLVKYSRTRRAEGKLCRLTVR